MNFNIIGGDKIITLHSIYNKKKSQITLFVITYNIIIVIYIV